MTEPAAMTPGPEADVTPGPAPAARPDRRVAVRSEVVWPDAVRSLEELVGSPVGARRSVEVAPSLLQSGERILSAATGFLDGRSGLLVTTNKRLIFLSRDEVLLDTGYQAIRSFRALAGLVVADLQIESDDRRAVIKQIHPRQRLADLAQILGRRTVSS